jgi:hypothetical protein
MKRKVFCLLAFLLTGTHLFAQEGMATFRLKITGEMADLLGPMMPNRMVLRFKDGNTRFSMEGGLAASMMGDFLYLGSEDKSFMIKDKEKTAYKMPEKSSEVETAEPAIEFLGVEKVNGYNCEKYHVLIQTEKEGSIDQILWATSEIQAPKPKKTSTGGSGAALFVKGIGGFPVKVEQNIKQAGIQIMQVIELEKFESAPQDPSQFVIPDNYKIKDFDPKMFGGMR